MIQTQLSRPKTYALRNQRGYGLIEVMLALVIIAILVAIAVALSINLRTSSSITNNVNHISQIASNAKKTFGVPNQYTAVTQLRAIRSVIPRELREFNPATQQYSDRAFNSFGGEIFAGYSHLTSNGDTFTFAWPNVPKDQCENIVTQVAGFMRRIEVEEGTAGTPLTALAAPVGDPLTQSAAVGAAATAATLVASSAGLPGTAGVKGTIVKQNDTELSTGALNDACNRGTENVRLWFWVGRS